MISPSLILIAGSLASSASDPTGGFISFPADWYKLVYEAQPANKAACFNELWRREFVNLRAMKFDTVVIQFSLMDCALFFNGKVTTGGSVLSPNTGDVIYKSVGAVLQEARNQKIKVWIGLRHKAAWNNSNWPTVVAGYKSVAEESLVVAQALVDSKLLNPETFAGWYISTEIDNYDKDFEKTIADGNAMLKSLSGGLDAIARNAGLIPAGSPRVPVAISAFYRSAAGNMDEPRYLKLLERTLSASGITHLFFQDSAGVEDSATAPKANLDQPTKDALVKRYASLLALGKSIGFETWAVIEVFAGNLGEVGAAEGRVSDQLKAAEACPKRIVYSSNDHFSEFATRSNVLKLFTAFYRKLSGMPFVPKPAAGCETK